MFDAIREWIIKVIKSRLFVLWLVILAMFLFALWKLFDLQIVNGEEYLNNFQLTIKKTVTTEGSRGNIYDRNGVLLAHNELSYSVTLEDNGTYESTKEKNKALNAEISTLIDMIESNGDSIVNDFNLSMDQDENMSFRVEGSSLQRFRADVYGKSSVDDLKVSDELGYDLASATPQQIYDYLVDSYQIDTEIYSTYRAYQIMVIRYGLAQNNFQRYISTDVALDVSDETVAMINEHAAELQGVEVVEDTKRVYDYPEYFSHIIGYTGKIDTEEYETLSQEDDSYTLTDVVGKSGIEETMELALQGKKGSKTIYVNNLGKILETTDVTEATAGSDVYLSIDANLQMAVYDMLEQELAGILYSKIINAKTYEGDDLYIPIYDVYTALVENSVIDVSALESAPEGSTQASVYAAFSGQKAAAIGNVSNALQGTTAYRDLSEELQEYVTYVVEMLQADDVFDSSAVDSSDSVYTQWKSGQISVREYLTHAIDSSWIDITALDISETYADTSEVYSALISYVADQLNGSDAFDKVVYKYLILSDQISGTQLCLILYEQGVLEENAESIAALQNGSLSAYTFLLGCIQSLQITPAQLALDPCTGSCVIVSPKTGELLACVTYPGYDTNRLANSMDSAYYSSLLNDGSLPLYNNATQQTTAPGSTFKMVTTAAGLTEGVITPTETIRDEGVYTKLGQNLHCWTYPSTHGSINVSEAIRHSCNYFFNEVGYRLSLDGSGTFDEDQGISILQSYAQAFGLGESTNIELPEGNSHTATEYPIAAAMGQSNNSFTTAQLARYAAAIANEGTVYDLTLLDHVASSDGSSVEEYTPTVRNVITNLETTTWTAMHEGMRAMVLEEHKEQFGDLKVALAGKTGTAQENESRPNHALFVGYAPYDDPEIAIAVRIAYGYTSSNACDLTANVMKYYFGEASEEELLNGQASNVNNSSNSFTD